MKRIKVLDYLVGLIDRYERNLSNDNERQALEGWQPDENLIDKSMPDRDLLTELNTKIWSRLAREYHLEGDALRNKQPSFVSRLWSGYRRYAALLALLLIVGGSLWFAHNGGYLFGTDERISLDDARQVFTADNLHPATYTLADGSVVKLNAGTRMEISQTAFNQHKREVWLTGEAFFEVAKDLSKPFIIHTGDMQTVVHGTSFNVKAYPELNENVVTVRDGRVEVLEDGRSLAMLTANRELTYHKADGASQLGEADWRDAAGWTEGRLVLKGVGADELKLRLRQRFGVEVIIEGDALSGRYLQGAFGKEATLEEVMNTISVIYNIHYTMNGDRLVITP